jgi:glycosyltransferase involved in cell wall biosynthesis
LGSIRKQDFDQKSIEILVVDGGSKDRTRDIALEYGAIVIENPRVQPECAKHEGLILARGTYVMFLDSDEELINIHALTQRIGILQDYPTVHAV